MNTVYIEYRVFCRLEPIQIDNQNTILKFQFCANNLQVSRSKYGLKSGPDTIFQISKRHPNASLHAW